MFKWMRLKIPGAAVAALLALPTAFMALNNPGSPAPDLESGSRWKIDIQVEMTGRYSLRSGPAAFEGDFSGIWAWSGFLEDDDGDFLLIHAKTEVLDWTIRERFSGNPAPSLLTEDDIPERPGLNISYILRDRDIVDIRFSISGFDVPLHTAEMSFALPLPSSRADSSRLPTSAYDASIVDGSNRIFLRNRDLKAPSKKKSFNWTWQKQDWVPQRERTLEFFSRHDAEVIVTLAPLR